MNASIILHITSVLVGVSYPRECYNIHGISFSKAIYRKGIGQREMASSLFFYRNTMGQLHQLSLL
jgi:hypothetical protein